jgi:hypothetical protein
MKFDDMKSVGHNIADSVSGCSFLIGVYDLDIFGEARRTPEGFILVDFLAGTSSGGSEEFRRAIALCPSALDQLCKKHGFSVTEFKTLTARYGVDRVYGGHFTVSIESKAGRRSSEQYVGMPGRRLRSRS